MEIKLFEAREGEFVAVYESASLPVPRIGESIVYLDDREDRYLKGRVLDVTYRTDHEEVVVDILQDLSYRHEEI